MILALNIREYQDSEFFPDICREVHFATEIPNVKEFFKDINSLLAGLSFKLTNKAASFIQSANDSQAELYIVYCYWLNSIKVATWLVNLKLKPAGREWIYLKNSSTLGISVALLFKYLKLIWKKLQILMTPTKHKPNAELRCVFYSANHF